MSDRKFPRDDIAQAEKKLLDAFRAECWCPADAQKIRMRCRMTDAYARKLRRLLNGARLASPRAAEILAYLDRTAD